jgi:parvulin-like peptidyl-prolyl isomerase
MATTQEVGRGRRWLRTGTRIVITQSIIDDIARQHQARWMRPPSEPELAGLVETQVRDEILYREGVALGLDRDDPFIKRRVRQKFEVIAEEEGARGTPSEADLATYLKRNEARFLQPATVSFDQIFLAGTGASADAERTLAATRAALARGANPGKLGAASMLPTQIEHAGVDVVSRDFGTAFAERLESLPVGEWTGPVASGFGTHLVRVTARTPAALPPLDTIRPSIAREWENERRAGSRSDSYQKMRGNYTVVIEARPTLAAQ